jgi:hypothetical protein
LGCTGFRSFDVIEAHKFRYLQSQFFVEHERRVPSMVTVFVHDGR